MRFTTLSFLLFFLLVYLIYWSLTGRARFVFIFLASVLFYATWSVGFGVHFVAMVAITYAIVRWMQRTSSNVPFYLGIAANVANLFLFKYFYLLLELISDITGSSALAAPVFNQWLLSKTGYDSIVLPLAISFYTFVLVAYLVDLRRGIIQEKHSFLEFSVFAMYFPHLVAGPIIRHSDFFFQLKDLRPDKQQIVRGMFLILTGLAKKVAIADNMLPLFGSIFQNPGNFSGPANLLGTASFSIWVYCDFSGYTDLARGMSLLLGIELPENFKAPFLSKSVRELWRNWHSTLGTWMRDYIYIPLGGSRRGEFRSQMNLLTTFTLGGLWHGAHYPYILWGFFHGLMLVCERYLELLSDRLGLFQKEYSRYLVWLSDVFKIAFVFLVFMVGVAFFNAVNVKSAFVMLGQMFTLASGPAAPNTDTLLLFILGGMLLNGLQKIKKWPRISDSTAIGLLLLYGFVVVYLLSKFAPGGKDFLYFQF